MPFIPQVTGLSSLHKQIRTQEDWVVGNVASSDTISLTDMGTVCPEGGQYGGISGVDIACNSSGSKTKSNKASGSFWKEAKKTYQSMTLQKILLA